jgi:hypothetical protein
VFKGEPHKTNSGEEFGAFKLAVAIGLLNREAVVSVRKALQGQVVAGLHFVVLIELAYGSFGTKVTAWFAGCVAWDVRVNLPVESVEVNRDGTTFDGSFWLANAVGGKEVVVSGQVQMIVLYVPGGDLQQAQRVTICTVGTDHCCNILAFYHKSGLKREDTAREAIQQGTQLVGAAKLSPFRASGKMGRYASGGVLRAGGWLWT